MAATYDVYADQLKYITCFTVQITDCITGPFKYCSDILTAYLRTHV